MNQIEDDASQEVSDIQKKNADDIYKINDLCLKSKADLQLTKNKNNDIEQITEKLEQEKQNKQIQLKNQKNKNALLSDESKKKYEEIKQKDFIIGEKEKKIY